MQQKNLFLNKYIQLYKELQVKNKQKRHYYT